MNTIANLTPHVISLHRIDGTVLEIVPSGLARCVESTEVVGDIGGIPIVRKTYGDVSGLPAESGDTVYIVSLLVVRACPARHDLFCVADTVRGADGKIIGARSLSRGGP